MSFTKTDLNLFLTFEVIYTERNLTKAAEILGITQPAVSNALSRLRDTFKDELFSKIKCEKKIGVDPFSGGNTRMTSDDFFKQNKEKFDCIFVDGLHHYDQVKKDIENSINCLNENGILLVHDCLPISISAQSIPRTEVNWNGDVWKSFVEQRTKENLDCYTIFADHGVGVILKRKNRSLLNLNIKNFKKLKFIYYYKLHQEIMNTIKFNELIKII